MSIIMFSEYDNPKDEVRRKKYYEVSKKSAEYWRRKINEKVVKNGSAWSDNTGHIIMWLELYSIDSYNELWKDDEFHKLMMEFTPLVDNLKSRLMRRTR